ncbi:epoxide hydrolase 1 isoform X2 [Aplysia californica]|uniref:Epoxide hydrolase 1 isoform X1 n=1 Tax=Aplysia californica TaxID=6500 RepID=A0ABM1VZX4_APLCA|nr:epoxide hydrolase 1 isoform X1 [Aplysia californica]XP_035827967.1 epoxide hydrolase 1 isoform X2 [Aplysia californica]
MSVGDLVEWLVVRLLSVFFGAAAILKMLKQTYRLGFKAVWGKKTFPKPKVLDDPSLGCHGYLHLEEVRLHYVASGPEDKPLMLFLHGFPEFWFSWRHQIREFQKDYRVVAIDQRGYGESDKPADVESYEMTRLMSDVRQTIVALGYRSCVLVAHDWGGAVAWAFARHFPDMVDRLIVMNAPSQPAFSKLLKSHSAQKKMSWYLLFFWLPYIPEISLRSNSFTMFDSLFKSLKSSAVELSSAAQQSVNQEEIAAYKYTFSQPGALTPPINWYRAAFTKSRQVRFDMDYVMPVLLIWGVKDVALHIDLVAEMKNRCPKMEVKRLEDSGHFVQNDSPQLVNEAMRGWLEGLGEGK